MDDVDYKLATLISIFDQKNPDELLQALGRSNSNLEACIESLVSGTDVIKSTGSSTKRKNTSIESFLVRASPSTSARESNTFDRTHKQSLPTIKRARTDLAGTDLTILEHSTRQSTDSLVKKNAFEPSDDSTDAFKTNAFDILKWNEDRVIMNSKLPVKILKQPDEVKSYLACCELVLDYLNKELANRLLKSSLAEAKSWDRHEFVINEKPVVSEHLSSFYVSGSGSLSIDSVIYGGKAAPDSRLMTEDMEEARELVDATVNERLSQRTRFPGEIPCRWRSNALVANCYTDETQNVGFHADRLTQIGPMPTIASVTLGATRVFRVRKITSEPGAPAQTLDIVLPHNSLLIMFPPCQEMFKHSVPSQKAVSLTWNDISGSARINLTFRHYRSDYTIADTPRCLCDNPCDLKPVMKKDYSLGKYFYQSKGIKVGTNCGFFQWLPLEEKITQAKQLRVV
ncbi:hypothetical protein SmJEL517_g04239 [Synchytrium microbalum]|uniref:Fe2OG dioxygenase domain-containing protein n=1 Tax=Synchytrium microbalum TaxID=1806994 RepID=A0A507BUZ4_9FUNG|nr:uncharacterized protein SmJEL517_g04239 [Synchytrium microbalum]TPX32737.1 hypothetical protein SmJEL517_g04239 [Synchytrium microbalum]